MTKNEAIKLLLELSHQYCYLGQEVIKHEPGETLESIDNFNFEELLTYFEKLDLPYDFVKRFINDELNGFASLEDELSYDEYDYLELHRAKNGQLELTVWTETCGNVYSLNSYGKTWKEYENLEDK